MIVIAYDGSDDAARAVEAAGRLFPGRPAVLVHVWAPVPPVLPMAAPGTIALPPADVEAETAALQRAAQRVADDGVRRARACGLDVEVVLVRGAGSGAVGEVVLAVAGERDASAIVVGRRGVSRIESVLLGSVSDTLVRHARIPVVVVPHHDDGG